MPEIQQIAANSPVAQNGQIPLSARQRLLAAQLLSQEAAANHGPIYSPGIVGAKVASGLLGGYLQQSQLKDIEDQQRAAASNLMLPLNGGGSAAPAASPAPPAPSAPSPAPPQSGGGVGPQAGLSAPGNSPVSPDERDLAIRTIIGEAGQEPPVGQAAVASVIKNRLASGNYGDSLKSVILAPKQFSVWNAGDPAGDLARKVSPDDPKYQQIGKIVDGVTSGQIPDPTNGAVNYYAPRGMPGGRAPDWAGSMGQGQPIGNHIFFGGKPAQTASADMPASGAINNEAQGLPPGITPQMANGSLTPGGDMGAELSAAPNPQAMAAQMQPMSDAIGGALAAQGGGAAPQPAGGPQGPLPGDFGTMGAQSPGDSTIPIPPTDAPRGPLAGDFGTMGGAPQDMPPPSTLPPQQARLAAALAQPSPDSTMPNLGPGAGGQGAPLGPGDLGGQAPVAPPGPTPAPPMANMPPPSAGVPNQALADALRQSSAVPGGPTPSVGMNLGPASSAPPVGPGAPQGDMQPTGPISAQAAIPPDIYRNRNPNNLPVAGQPMTDQMPSPGSAPYNPPVRNTGGVDFAAERQKALADAIARYGGNPIASDQPQGNVAPNIPTPPVRPANLGAPGPIPPAMATTAPGAMPAPVPPPGSPAPQMLAPPPGPTPVMTGRTNNSVQTPTQFNLAQANPKAALLAAALAPQNGGAPSGPAPTGPAPQQSYIAKLAAMLAPQSAAAQASPSGPMPSQGGLSSQQPGQTNAPPSAQAGQPPGFNPYANVPNAVIQQYNALVTNPYATPQMVEAAQQRIAAYMPRAVPDNSVMYNPGAPSGQQFTTMPIPHKFDASRNGIIYDQSTGQTANGAGNGAPLTKVMSPDEVKGAGLNPGSYQRNSITNEISPIASPAGNDPNTYSEDMVKAVGGYHASLAAGVPQAQANVRAYNAMAGALQRLQSAGGTTGFGAEEIKDLKSAINTGANAIGIAPPNDISNQEEMASFGRTLAGGIAKSNVGTRVTNFEMKNFLEANPGLDLSPAGNQRLIGIGAQIEQRKADIGGKILDLTTQAMQNGQRPNAGQVQEMIKAYDADPANHIRDPISGQDLTQNYKLPAPGAQNAPPASQPAVAAAPAPASSGAPSAPAAPSVGTVQKGHVFLGGDPSSPSSWGAVRQ